MRYVSIDIETTGLSPDASDIIEFGAVVEDTNVVDKSIDELPFFHAYVLPPFREQYGRHVYVGDPYAISMHGDIFKRIATQADGYRYLQTHELGSAFRTFLEEQKLGLPLLAAGKNFASFDKIFLERLPEFTNYVCFNHRSLDPTILYLQKDDISPPSSKVCMERAGIKGDVVHTALEDAKIVIKLFRNGWKPTK